MTTLLEWSGFVRAGVVQDVPGHLVELEPVRESLWDMSFHLEVEAAPEVLEVKLAWTAPAAEFMLMLIPPRGTGPEVLYETPEPLDGVPQYSGVSPICMQIPPPDLVPGSWSVMAHSGYAVDAELDFAVTVTGGNVTIADHDHLYTVPELVDVIADHANVSPLGCAA